MLKGFWYDITFNNLNVNFCNFMQKLVHFLHEIHLFLVKNLVVIHVNLHNFTSKLWYVISEKKLTVSKKIPWNNVNLFES